MSDPLFDELNTITHKEIYPAAVYDQFFKDDPFFAYLRDHALAPWDGGAFMQQAHVVKPLIAGAYALGETFDISMREILASTVFVPKHYEANVTEQIELIRGLNTGSRAVFSKISIDMKVALQTLNNVVSIAAHRHGQASGGGVIGDRILHINGWAEAINDGISNSWEGSVFPTYGGLTRGGFSGSTMNSIPRFLGDSTGASGELSYIELERGFQDAAIGPEEPDLIVTSREGVTIIKNRIQSQQRFPVPGEKDPIWGVTGFKFNGAMVLKSDYWPSTRYGKNDPDLGDYSVSNFTSGASVDALSGLPASTVIKPGEILAMFNTKYWLLRISDDELLGGGFTGFKEAQDTTIVAGQTLLELNLLCVSPRLQKQIYGFNS